uniref:Uncharacterized protein n=1 Tax=Glossina morsitans morsitans TaxID=37546 RepID=A0A1B0GCV8_GLOMM
MVQELCRVCATAAHEDTAIKLFERNQKELLQQLRLLTGSMIKNSIGYPRLVCWTCQQKLMDAYAFRQCFVKSQLFFKEKMREKLMAMQEAKKFKEETRTSKDTELLTLNTVKEEEENDNNDRKKEDHEDVYESSGYENVLKEEEHQGLPKDDTVEGEEDIEFVNIDQKIETSFSEYENDNEDEPGEIMNNASVEKKSPEKLQMEKKKTFKGRKKRKNVPEEPRQYICDQCGNHFSCRHHFVIHLRRHTGDKQYACE